MPVAWTGGGLSLAAGLVEQLEDRLQRALERGEGGGELAADVASSFRSI